MHLVFAFFSAMFAGLVAILAKVGLKNVDSNLGTTIRAIFMALFLILFVSIFNRNTFENIKNIETRDWVIIALSGVAGAVSWLFYFLALKNSGDDTTKVAAIDKLSIVFVLIFSIFVLRDKVELPTIIGVVLMTIGAIVMTIKF